MPLPQTPSIQRITYSLFGRIISAAIWTFVVFMALPKILLISNRNSLFLALFVGLAILIFDSVVNKQFKRKEFAFVYSILFAGRIVCSILMSWIGGFAITLRTFWSLYLGYDKIYDGENYIEVFVRMLENNRDVLMSFIVISIAIFIGDNIGRVINRLAIQESVIAEKEDTIQVQESEIQHKDEQLEQSYQQQINIISSIQHELGNKLPIAKNTLSDLKAAFEKIPSFDLDQKIRQRLPGESEASIDSFADLHKRLESNLFYAISIVDNIRGVLKADPTRFEPVKVNLKNYLQSEIPKHIGTIPDLSWEIIGQDVAIAIDRSQFSILLHNVIENARRHGFTDLANKPAMMQFEIGETPESVALKIRNNGLSLPSGFTLEKYTRPGAVLGPTGHSGLGGYLIGLVAANHKAKLNVTEAESPYTVDVSLTFPKN